MDVKTTLLGARKILLRGWTKGDFARNKSGAFCHPLSKEAVSHDFVGAIRVVLKDNERYMPLVHIIEKELDGLTIDAFNDRPETTIDDVLAVIDLVIEKTASNKITAKTYNSTG